MRRLHMIIPAALCVCALTFSGSMVSAAQGKAKGHEKQAQKESKAQKKTSKDSRKGGRAVGTSGAPMRFHGLDMNGDGVITRAEWRGNDRSFSNEDWNRDGILSGDEVRPGAKRPARRSVEPARSATGSGGNDPDAAIFARLDTNRDGVLSRREWNKSVDEFNRVDFNHDGVLNPYEFGVGR